MFKIVTPWTGAIGNMSEDIYTSLLTARREKKKVIFLYPYDLFKPFHFSKFGLGVNKELKKIESEYILLSQNNPLVVLCNLILTCIYVVLISIECFFRIFFKIKLPIWFRFPVLGRTGIYARNRQKVFDLDEIEKWGWEEDFENFISIKMDKNSYQKAKKIKFKMGIPENSWFVCLHTRDSGYYTQVADYKEGANKITRNTDINNYIKVIKYITDKGGWVIRLGNNKMKKLPKMKNLIDYPFTIFKSYLMDIFLLQECKFFLGNPSGIAEVATMFQKPCVYVNSVSDIILPPTGKKNNLRIYSHVYSNLKKRFLSLTEIVEETKNNKDIYQLQNTIPEYKIVENSEDEILDLVKEFMEKKDQNFEPTDIQKNFNKKTKLAGKEILRRKVYSEKFSKMEKFRKAKLLFSTNGSLGNNYLEKNL